MSNASGAGQNLSSPTGWVERHGRLLALLGVATLAVVILVPGYGDPGLWDPWEMDRAHVAREMAGPAKTLVLERLGDKAGVGAADGRIEGDRIDDGRITARLREGHAGEIRLLSAAHGEAVVSRARRVKATRRTLDEEVVHLLLIDGATLIGDATRESGLEQAARQLDQWSSEQPGMLIGVDTSSVDMSPDELRAALGAALARATLHDAQNRTGLLRDLSKEDSEALADELASDERFAPHVTFFSGVDSPAFDELVVSATARPAKWAQFRADGESQAVPALDYWLTALSYKIFGFTESSARLPFLLWGLLGVVIVVLVTRRLFDDETALLAALALVTMPLYAGQGRHISGEISFAVTLAAGLGAFFVLARDGLKTGWLALFLSAVVLAFLSNGLTALLVLWVTALAYILALDARSRGALVAFAALTGLFAVATALVLTPSDWTFFTQFKFMDRMFEGGPPRNVRNFDYFIRELGFGLVPWTALLPFAIGRTWLKGDRDGDGKGDAYHGVILWFVMPFVLLALMLRDFSHCVVPIAPAAAVALGVLLKDLSHGDRARGLLAFFSLVFLVILLKQLKTSAEPLTSFLTYDPPFSAKTSPFPESIHMSRAVRYIALFGGLLIFVWGFRIGSVLRRGAQLFRRSGPLWSALFALTTTLAVVMIGSLMWSFDTSLSLPSSRGLQPSYRLAVRAVMLHPIAILYYALLISGLWLWLLGYSDWGRSIQARRPLVGRLFGGLARRVPAKVFITIAGVILVTGAGALFAGLASEWGPLAAKVFPNDPDTVVHDILLKNRGTLGIVGLIALLVGNRLWIEPWRRYATVFRVLEVFERPRPALAAFAIGAAVMTFSVTHDLYAELSLHVSQKHILETYYAAEGRDDLGDNIFKHGKFGRSGGGDVNFYTNQIPEMADRASVIAALRRDKDVVTRLSGLEAGPETVLLRGFDPRDDPNGDGTRDWHAWGGIATSAGDGFLEDLQASWTPDRWRGAHLILAGGQDLPVTGNTSTRLSVDGRPRLPASPSGRRYAIDSADAPVHDATAETQERSYFLLPKLRFSELNYAFRKQYDGEPIPVLDAASSRLILAVSALREGEPDQNWIAAAVTTEDEMRSRDWFPDSDEDRFHPVYANWNDQIEILGWTMESEKVSRRKDYRIKMFFRCKTAMKTSFKIFMHVDRAGTANRIHSDHWPLNLEKSPGDDPEKTCRGCFQTRHWMPGDIVVDSFSHEVPLGTPSGPQEIWLGFYNPGSQKRLPIKDFDKKTIQHDGSNRIRIGSFEVN